MTAAVQGTVYLVHLDRPFGHAKHYTGFALNLRRRLAQHRRGKGAHLLALAQDAGITWQLARTWEGTRAEERRLKNMGGASRRCPMCGVQPRVRRVCELPRNTDGSLSRARTTDAEKAAAGVMTAAQLAEHTALRSGAISGRPERPAERGPLSPGADPWLVPAETPAGAR
jgi:predicted GIY-YIG superfamily endonuclease